MTKAFDNSILHLLHRALQVTESHYARAQVDADLTPRQFIVLSAIAENEGLSQTAIVTRSGIDRSTMADVIRRLIANGLVQRRRSKADARAFHIKLTPSGHDTLKRAQVVVSATDEKAMQKFAASARREFVRFLQEIIDSSPLTDAQSGAKPNPTGRR